MKKLIVLFALAFTLKASAITGCISNVYFTPICSTNSCTTVCGQMHTDQGTTRGMETNAYPVIINSSCGITNLCSSTGPNLDFYRIGFDVDCSLFNCCNGSKPLGILSWDGPGGHQTVQVDIPPNVCSGYVVFHAPTCSTECAEQNPTYCVRKLQECSTQGGGGDTD